MAAPPHRHEPPYTSLKGSPGNWRLWSASALGRCPPLAHRAGHMMEANKPWPRRSSKKQGQPAGAYGPGPAARRLPRWRQHRWPGVGSHHDRASRGDIARPQRGPSSTCRPVSPSLGPKRPGAPAGATCPAPIPTDRLGDLEHITSLSFPICKMRGQRRCPQGPSSTTQWSADPSSHWAQPGPAVRTHTCLPGRSSIHPPHTSYLCPAQHPLPQLPTRPAGPLEPQPGCGPGLQLGPGHGGVGAAGGSTAAPGSLPLAQSRKVIGGSPGRGSKAGRRDRAPSPSGLPLGVQARKAPGALSSTWKPALLGLREVPVCACLQREGREGAQRSHRTTGLSRGPDPPPPHPQLLDIWGDPVGKGRWPGSPASFPGGPPPQSCPCETCHLQAGAPGQAGWGQGAGSGLRLDQDHCPAGLGSGQTPYLSPQRLGPPSPGERKRVQRLLLPPGCPTVLNQACGLPLGQSPRSEPHHPQLEVTEQAPSQG